MQLSSSKATALQSAASQAGVGWHWRWLHRPPKTACDPAQWAALPCCWAAAAQSAHHAREQVPSLRAPRADPPAFPPAASRLTIH